MARGILQAIIVVAAAVLVVADVVVYEEDLNNDDIPGFQGHSWTVVDDGQDGSSKYVMQVQKMSMNGADGGMPAMSNLLADMGFNMDEPGSWGAWSTDDSDWPAQGYGGGPNMPDSFFSSPFLVHGALTGPFQLSIFGAPAGGDQHGIYPGSQEQMLQNVACSRFGPALIAMRSQDSNVMTWDDNAEEREGEELDNQFLFDGEGIVAQEAYGDTSSAVRKANLCNRVVFITLLFGCFLTLYICIRQGIELRRAMKEASQIATEVNGDEHEKKPLLASLEHKGLQEDDDGYTNVMISPVYSGPAFKAIYPASPKGLN